MEHKVNQGFGMLIGASVVASAAATVYFVSMGYSRYQQNQAIQDQFEQNKGVPVSAIELPPLKIPTSSPSPQEELTRRPSLPTTTTFFPSPTMTPTRSITPLTTMTVGVNVPGNTPTPTSHLTPTSTPTPSQIPLLDTPTPSQTQPASMPTPVLPTSTIPIIPTIDPKLCKVAPEQTRHPHYCTPTPNSGGS